MMHVFRTTRLIYIKHYCSIKIPQHNSRCYVLITFCKEQCISTCRLYQQLSAFYVDFWGDILIKLIELQMLYTSFCLQQFVGIFLSRLDLQLLNCRVLVSEVFIQDSNRRFSTSEFATHMHTNSFTVYLN